MLSQLINTKNTRLDKKSNKKNQSGDINFGKNLFSFKKAGQIHNIKHNYTINQIKKKYDQDHILHNDTIDMGRTSTNNQGSN